MNMEASMDRAVHLRERERKLLEDALAALRRTTGLKATVVAREPRTPKGARPDAAIEIEGNGKRLRFFVEIKAVDRAIVLAAAKQQLEPFGRQGVLVAPYLTAELANCCRTKLDLQFIDTAGNAYLRAPGLYVHIRGERPQGPAGTVKGTRGGGTATALRVVFALLCKPELLNARYREIVAAAGVALGAVGWVFFDLQGRGYVLGGRRARSRRLLEPGRLLEEWVTNYPIKLRPKLNRHRFRALDPNWWQKARLTDGALWGGEVAANRLTGDLKPATCAIYIHPAARRAGVAELVREHRLRADPEGEVEILDTFWNLAADPTKPQLVPPLLVYADLVATLDPRNLEIAKRIREEHIEHALRRT
jgi:hypothetical protein